MATYEHYRDQRMKLPEKTMKNETRAIFFAVFTTDTVTTTKISVSE